MTSSNEPDQIRADIERTRNELSSDVDRLTEKVSPGRIVHRRVDAVKDGVASVKDRVMGSASSGSDAISSVGSSVGSAASSVADAASSAPAMVRERTTGNPIAVGVIAFGLGWLVSSLIPASETETRVAGEVKDKAAEVAQPVVTDAVKEVAHNLREPAHQAVEQVKETAQDAAASVTDEARSAAAGVKDDARSAAYDVRDAARQP